MWTTAVWVGKHLILGGVLPVQPVSGVNQVNLYPPPALWMNRAKKDRFLYPTRIITIWGALYIIPQIWGVPKTPKSNK